MTPLQEAKRQFAVWECPVHGQRDYPSGSAGQCGAAIRVDGQPFELRLYCQRTLAKVEVVPHAVADNLADAELIAAALNAYKAPAELAAQEGESGPAMGVACGNCGGNVLMATCHYFRGTGHEWVLVSICMVCRAVHWVESGCLMPSRSDWQCGVCSALESAGGCGHDFETSYQEVILPISGRAIERGARVIAGAHRNDGAPAFDDATDAERARWRGFSRTMAEAFADGQDG